MAPDSECELSMPGPWEEEREEVVSSSKAQKAQRVQMWSGETALVTHPQAGREMESWGKSRKVSWTGR